MDLGCPSQRKTKNLVECSEHMVSLNFRFSCELRGLEGDHDRSIEFQYRYPSFMYFPSINGPGIFELLANLGACKLNQSSGTCTSRSKVFKTIVGRTSYQDAAALDIQVNRC